MVTPGSTPPVESVTVPPMDASCANAASGSARITPMTNSDVRTHAFIDILLNTVQRPHLCECAGNLRFDGCPGNTSNGLAGDRNSQPANQRNVGRELPMPHRCQLRCGGCLADGDQVGCDRDREQDRLE